MKTFFAGLDLGRRQDFTALALVERATLKGPWDPADYGFPESIALRVRYVERIPLGTEYVEVAARVKRVVDSLASLGPVHLVVDATGVGAPVVEFLRRARMACRLWAVSITGGDAEGFAQGVYRVPKRDLVVGLQLLFEKGELQIAEGLSERTTLVQELSDMRVKVTPSGHEQYEAGKSGQHDDLVSALSLACWCVRKMWGGAGIGERRRRIV